MNPVQRIDGEGSAPLVLTCEHASCRVPVEYDGLGLDAADLREHFGWDIGAASLTERLAGTFGAPAVLGGVSRLVIDCNRDLSDHDLILDDRHGLCVPGNRGVDRDERERRIRDFYLPFHRAVDEVMEQQPGAFLLSVHSFTPVLNGRERRFDVGVLFDEWAEDARRLGEVIGQAGMRVRYNEPYSGLDGLIFSARTHGQRHGVRYLEIEVNNRLLRDDASVRAVAARLSAALRELLGLR